MAAFNLDDTETWAQIRGDSMSVGDVRNVSLNNAFNGVLSRRFSARGSIIRECARSYFVFDLSGESGTITEGNFVFYMDNTGTSSGVSSQITIVEATTLAGTAADYGNCFVADTATVTDNATFFGANF